MQAQQFMPSKRDRARRTEDGKRQLFPFEAVQSVLCHRFRPCRFFVRRSLSVAQLLDFSQAPPSSRNVSGHGPSGSMRDIGNLAAHRIGPGGSVDKTHR